MPFKLKGRDLSDTAHKIYNFCTKEENGKYILYNYPFNRLLRKLGFELVDTEFKGDCQDYAFTTIGFPKYSFKNHGKLEIDVWDHDLIDVPEFEKTRNFKEGNILAYYNPNGIWAWNADPTPFVHYGIVRIIKEKLFVESKLGREHYVYKHNLEDFIHSHAVEMYQLK